jgi:hypothetical protein
LLGKHRAERRRRRRRWGRRRGLSSRRQRWRCACSLASAAPGAPRCRAGRSHLSERFELRQMIVCRDARCAAPSERHNCIGLAESWAKFRPLIEILSQNAGPSHVFSANPVQLVLARRGRSPVGRRRWSPLSTYARAARYASDPVHNACVCLVDLCSPIGDLFVKPGLKRL